MRITRVVAGFTATVTAVLGLSLATTGPAAAATGTWRAYGNTNPITSSSSTWRCGTTMPVDTSVIAQVCAVRSPGGLNAQGAVIVRNNRSSLYGATAYVDLYSEGGANHGNWTCPTSGVGAHSWSVCFGATATFNRRVAVNSDGSVNGTELPISPWNY